MNNGGDVADQMVREGMQVAEEGIKLSALGVKNLIAIALVVAKENPKVRGKTNLDRILREGKEMKVFSLRAEDLKTFQNNAKKFGVLFAAIKDKKNGGELVEVLAKAEDVALLNHIFESMGYQVPKERVFTRKKDQTRHQPESDLMTHAGAGINAGQKLSEQPRPFVRAAIQHLRAAARAAEAAQQKTHEIEPQAKER